MVGKLFRARPRLPFRGPWDNVRSPEHAMNENFTASDFAAFCAAHHPAYQRNYYAMYSSWWDGITTDPNLMVIPIDDHMVHRGDALFETCKTLSGAVYLFPEHLARLEAEQAAFNRRPVTAQNLSAHFRAARQFERDIAQNREMLEKLESMPDYDANLFHRIGRCYFNTDRYWEARVAFARVVATAAEDDIREAAHFDLVLSISRLRRFDDLILEAGRYLTVYDPHGKWQ